MKFDKFKNGVKKVGSRIAGAISGIGVTAGTCITAMAAEGDNEAVNAAKTLLTEASQTLNITNVVAILSAGIGIVISFFLAWWGARKLFNMLQSAFKKGKIKL